MERVQRDMPKLMLVRNTNSPLGTLFLEGLHLGYRIDFDKRVILDQEDFVSDLAALSNK